MVNRILGVLGGMGPLASAHFMTRLTRLTPASRDQDHIPTILWSDPRVPDRTAAALAGGEDPLPALHRGLRALAAAGAGAIVVPCNTAHGWFGRMQASIEIPILHIVDAAARVLGELAVPPRRIGLLGTAGTLAMRLYQDRLTPLGYDCVTPDSAELADLVTPAIEQVKANRVAAAHAVLIEAATRLRSRGAEVILLGCTELPVALSAGPPAAFPIVDSIDALAQAAIAWALDAGDQSQSHPSVGPMAPRTT
jgi:aspartate racemase